MRTISGRAGEIRVALEFPLRVAKIDRAAFVGRTGECRPKQNGRRDQRCQVDQAARRHPAHRTSLFVGNYPKQSIYVRPNVSSLHGLLGLLKMAELTALGGNPGGGGD